ncbi:MULTISPECIES: replication initiation protein [unclassified Bacillus cereus group]|uniref:replication initiation protein n=1 Tax=unclassified Bacillus cereus group TaxID=2750818 RepID=UPI001F57B3DB
MSIKQELQVKEYNIVSKSNRLIEANSCLSLIEQKILLCLASNIEPNDKNFKTYTFSIKKFHNLLGLKGAAKYTELKTITKQLLAKVVEIHNGEELIQTSWLSSAIYNEKKGTIDIRFDPLLKPFLLELNNKFTSYRLGNVIKLKSIYSIRIYELLKQYENLKERTLSLETLRYYVDAIKIYPNYANFKQRILKPVQKELKNNTDISFEFTEIKKGRKVYKIKFYILSKNKGLYKFNSTDIISPKPHPIDNFNMKIEEFELQFQQKIPYKTLKKWSEHKNITLKLIDNVLERKGILSPIAYIEYMLNTHIQNTKNNSANTNDIVEGIFNAVKKKFATSTGTIATFLVKDTFLSLTKNNIDLDTAETIWKEHEEEIMKQIYAVIKKNKRRNY